MQQVQTTLKKMREFNKPLPKLEFDKNRFRVKHCPCGKSNKDGKFRPYVGHEAKGYCHSCGQTFLPELPKLDQWNSTEPQIFNAKTETVQFIITQTVINFEVSEENYFTEIDIYKNSPKGILFHYCLNGLLKRLNTFKNINQNKIDNPAILKGLYFDGTSGEFCKHTAPFIFFDIDVKDTENIELLVPEKNKLVFDFLKSASILVWRSNSGKGIAGILHTPQFNKIDNCQTELHLTISKSIYIFLSGLIKEATGITVHFDFQQGKFRQIRYLAEQKEAAVINSTPLSFSFAKPQPKPASFISNEVFKASLKAYEANCFVQYLNELFGVEVASELIKKYFIGTSKHWQGATVFWQINKNGKVRTGKIMLYNATTGKRIKEPFNHINWVHSALKMPEFELRQCLFGEHLLIDKAKPVAIVESEKTAVIASVYRPEFIWLATGGKDGLKAEFCSVLAGRTIKLFPDLNCFDKWSAIAKKIFNSELVEVSDLLERNASEAERKQGFDLADYLIRFDFREFTQPEAEASQPPPAVQEVPILPTSEELQYSKMAASNPHVEMLVKQLGLVSATTGKPLMKFDV